MKFKDYMKPLREAKIPKENEVDDKGIEKGSKSIFSKLKKKEPSKEERQDKLKQSRVDAEEERNLNKALAAGLDVKIPGVETEDKDPMGGKGGGVELSGKEEKDEKDKEETPEGEKPKNPFAKKDDSKDTEDDECEDGDEECLKKKKKKNEKNESEYKLDFFSLI